jgi:hypothetical protein
MKLFTTPRRNMLRLDGASPGYSSLASCLNVMKRARTEATYVVFGKAVGSNNVA